MLDDSAIRTIEVEDEHRSAMVEAINKALEIFCCHSELTFAEVMQNGLSPIADAIDVSCIIVYRYVKINSEKRLKQLYRWDKQEGALAGEGIEILLNTPTIAGWLGFLQQDLCVNKRLCEMSGDEVAFANGFGVKSVLLVPVFTHGEFWGCLVLQDHGAERIFDDECVGLMRSVAYLCANAVIRDEMEREVADKNEFNHMLFENAPIGLTMFDEFFNVIDCNETALAMFGVAKQYYMDHFYELSPEYQPDGSKTVDRIQDVLKRTLSGEKLVMEWMHQTPSGEPIPCEVTLTRIKYEGKYIGVGFMYDLRRIKSMEKTIAEEEERSRAVTEASPISYILFNEKMEVVDCNDATLRVFGCPDKQYMLDHYWDKFSPEYQPDGQKSSDKAAAIVKETTNCGKTVHEWIHRTLNGELLPVENTMMQMMYNGERYFISHKYDLRNVKKMEENIRLLETEAEKIYFDSLTGIRNRRYFDENFGRIIKLLSRSGGKLSLMMIDIDFFKNYNDTYGHNNGDTCLKIVAETLSQSVTRADDFVARYGGEEFVVVLPNTDKEGACMIAKKLLENVQARKILHEKSAAADCVTVSIGVTSSNVTHSQGVDDYVRRADEMLYKSKQSGRNKSSFGEL